MITRHINIKNIFKPVHTDLLITNKFEQPHYSFIYFLHINGGDIF